MLTRLSNLNKLKGNLALAAAACFVFISACSRPPSTPVETFKTYVKAIKAKDVKGMRVLLSDATLKMHERQAVAQGTTVDEIIKRETLFQENQRSVEFRDVCGHDRVYGVDRFHPFSSRDAVERRRYRSAAGHARGHGECR